MDKRFIHAAGAVAALAVIIFSVLKCSGADGSRLFINTERSEAPLELNVTASTKIDVLTDDGIVSMPLEEYLVGVVAAEMPVSYEAEALKAQAVAARTYTIRKAQRGGCSRGAGADICTDSGHCQAYADEKRLKERWGEEYGIKLEKIRDAVYSTSGEILIYEGEAIEALFCASAGGMTENSENVYTQARDYLKSVESPDTEGYTFEKVYSRTELAARIKKRLSVTVAAKKLEAQLEILSRYPSGRVKKIRIGGKTFSGTKARGALGLSSANFSFKFSGDSVIFTSVGYGHGIGMSQSGADALAKQGMTYEKILLYYYQGVTLIKEY